MKARDSLYLRLLLLALAVVIACGGAAAVVSYRNALHEADELMDAQMAQTAQTLLAVTAHGPDNELEDVAADTGPARHKYQPKILFQLWHTVDGRRSLVLRSPNAPDQALVVEPKSGFVSGTWNGQRWRFFALGDSTSGLFAIVGQDFAIREELAQETARHGLVPFLIGLPLLALLLHFAIRGGLAPLRHLAADLATRAPDRLEPLALERPPRELAPVSEALNRLFARVAATLENERRFTADAAHELRNPLAALITQLQVAQLAGDDGDLSERRKVLEKCVQGAHRMTHLVEQLLTLARLEAGPDVLAREPLDLAQVATEVCADLGARAIAANIALELDAPAALSFAGQPELTQVLLRNLIDNALRYTPTGGRVEVAVAREGDAARLTVQDSGPGVPAEQRELLGQRFRRLGGQGIEGVGLGLSIVRRVVDLHAGRIEFGSTAALGGLRVKVWLPLAAQGGTAA